MRLSLMLALAATPALADPVGRYVVDGTNPGLEDGTYAGLVEVVRLGETYAVTWWIGDEIYEGTALGATLSGGRLVTGPASPADTALVIGYPAGVVVMQETTGGMAGQWALIGHDALGREVWTRQD